MSDFMILIHLTRLGYVGQCGSKKGPFFQQVLFVLRLWEMKSLLCGVRTCGWAFGSQGNEKTVLLEDALFRFLIPGADVDR